MRAPSRRVLAWLVAGTLAGLPVLPVSPATGSPTCANELEPRNEWSEVPVPRTSGPVAVAQADDDPCVMVATDNTRHVYRTLDGGLHWSKPTTVDVDVVRPVMASLAQRRVLLVKAAGGLLVSSDGGVSFSNASGLDAVGVVDVAADPTSKSRVYATGRQGSPVPVGPLPVPGPTTGLSIWVSADFGSSWTPLAGSVPVGANHVSVDADQPTLVWADSASAGVWLSDNQGQTFVSKDTSVTYDVATAPIEGGGTVVIASTGSGLKRSTDGGDTWSSRLSGLNVRELVLETGHPVAYMMVANGTVQRSKDDGKTAAEENVGLPSGCAPYGLTADASEPSTFLVTCGIDGAAYRYRNDGSGWNWIDWWDVPDPWGLNPRLPRYKMDELAEIELPDDQDGESAAIAFDGEMLYYADNNDRGVIHRVVSKTGTKMPDLKLPVKLAARGLTYDSLRHLLYALDGSNIMWRIDLRTGATTKLFKDLVNTFDTGRWTSYSFDTSIDRFRAVFDGSPDLYEVDTGGRITASCQIPQALLYQPAGGGPPGFQDGATSGPSAVVATGDGGVYVQNEDDATILRLNRTCRPLAIFDHRNFSEASLENDQIACDTNTFDQPAIWIRDSQAKSAFAFAVPGGYCALATALHVTTRPTVANVDRAPVCAELRLAGKDTPVAGQTVHLYVGKHEVGAAPTNGAGVACVEYHPAAYPEHASPPQPAAGQRPIDRRDHEQVVANYLGTIAYRPSRGLGQATVTTFVPPLDPLPKPPRPPLLELPPAVVIAAPPPPLPVAPPQAPPPQPNPQPLPNPHPGAQPGAFGQPGAAVDRQEEAEVADQSADVREFRARVPEPQPELPMAIVGFAFGAALLEQRRRRSRVREVGA